MKLRVARKILKATDCDHHQWRHRDGTVLRALDRDAKSYSTKETNRFWNRAMDLIGPLGRAEIVFNATISKYERPEK